MDGSSSAGAQLQPTATSPAANAGSIVLRVAWLAILLGLFMQVLLIACAAAFGKVGSSGRILTATLQTVSWSTFVCTGIAIGAVVSKLQVGATALAGLISAPIAFNIARTVQRGVATALHQAIAPGGPSPLVLGTFKALEYGVLSAVISVLATRNKGGMHTRLPGLPWARFSEELPSCMSTRSRTALWPTWRRAPSMKFCSLWAARWCCSPRKR